MVCGAYAASSVENMILCQAAEEAQVSRDAAPVMMKDLLVTALTDDQAIRSDPPALVLRVENIYVQNEQHFVALLGDCQHVVFDVQ